MGLFHYVFVVNCLSLVALVTYKYCGFDVYHCFVHFMGMSNGVVVITIMATSTVGTCTVMTIEYLLFLYTVTIKLGKCKLLSS